MIPIPYAGRRLFFDAYADKPCGRSLSYPRIYIYRATSVERHPPGKKGDRDRGIHGIQTGRAEHNRILETAGTIGDVSAPGVEKHVVKKKS
jgi:hypothetical protein